MTKIRRTDIMNRIEKRMKELQKKNEKAFVTYMTAGLPDMEGTKSLNQSTGRSRN